MSTKQRINLYMDDDVLAVLDAFAAVTGKSRTAVIHALIRPAMPSLVQLLEAADDIASTTQAEREESLARLGEIEKRARANVQKVPELISKVVTKPTHGGKSFYEWCDHYGVDPATAQARVDYDRYVDQLDLFQTSGMTAP